jgi:hypothetical protein
MVIVKVKFFFKFQIDIFYALVIKDSGLQSSWSDFNPGHNLWLPAVRIHLLATITQVLVGVSRKRVLTAMSRNCKA